MSTPIATQEPMRDQQDDQKPRQASSSQPQPARQTDDRKRRYETLSGTDADEPQICRGID